MASWERIEEALIEVLQDEWNIQWTTETERRVILDTHPKGPELDLTALAKALEPKLNP